MPLAINSPRLLCSPATTMSSQSKFNDYPHTLPPDADYEKQAIPVPGTGRPGETREWTRSYAGVCVS